MAPAPSPGNRIVFLDNLRLLAVLAVLVLHAGIAYAPSITWWYVADPDKSRVFDLLLAVIDGFAMPVLFAIAGFVALPSLRRHGPAGFCLAKLRRLGLPLVVLTVLFSPVISYVVFLGRGGNEIYPAFWLRLLPTALDWRFHVLTADNVAVLAGALWAYHLWFLGVLLLFCLGLALVAACAGHGLAAPAGRTGGGWGAALLLLAVGLAEAAGQAVVPDTVWMSFGPFFEGQPARLPLYCGMFVLGLWAGRHGWAAVRPLPGKTWVWGLAAVAALVGMLAAGAANLAVGPKPAWIPVVYGLARAAAGIGVTGLLLVFGQRHWNRSGRVGAGLAAASYDIYLTHLPLMVLLQYRLTGLDRPAGLKFAVVFLTVLVVCWGASRLAAGRRRLWVPVGTLAAFALSLIVL